MVLWHDHIPKSWSSIVHAAVNFEVKMHPVDIVMFETQGGGGGGGILSYTY